MNTTLRLRHGNRLSDRLIEPDAWMLTFSDLIMLVLTFFILRYSMAARSAPGPEQAGVPAAVAVGGEGATELEVRVPTLTAIRVEPGSVADALGRSFGVPAIQTEFGGSYRYPGGVILREGKERTVLELPGSTFVSGSSELSFLGRELLRGVAGALAGRAVALRIEAHSEPSEQIELSAKPGRPEFRSLWELTGVRAIVAGRQMIDAGVDPFAISVMGYGDSKPVQTGAHGAAHYHNRRLELVITDPKTTAQN